MNTLQNSSLVIDPDFEKIMPLLSEREFQNLKHKIIYEGMLPVIFTWNKKIIKGLAEYKVCRTWNIPFFITEKNECSHIELIVWMCMESIRTQNLSKKHLRYCIGRLYNAQKKLLAQKLSKGTIPADYPKDSFSKRNSSRTYTANLLNDLYPLSPGTVYQYGTYASSIDEIDLKIPGLAKKLLSGEFNLCCKETVMLRSLSPEEIRFIYKKITEEKDYSFLPSREKYRLEFLEQTARAKQKDKEPAIKKMPPYDPNAELSSLTLTIPMWINTIKRTKAGNWPGEASVPAFENLSRQLSLLEQQIHSLQKKIEENYHV